MTRYASIVSTGRFLPEIEITNDVLREQFAHLPDFVDKMEASSGIRSRWHAPEDWATSDVALPAARQALERAGRTPEDVDLIILGTDSPDYITPATSVVLQHKLGATERRHFDIGCACASFPTGLATAAGFIATNPAIKTVLVVGVYLMHKLADPDDPMTFFYGDGAGRRCSRRRRARVPQRRRSSRTASTTSTGASTPAGRSSRPRRNR